MNKIAKLLACVIIILAAACSKEEVIPANGVVAGTWQLDAVYSDPGDGSGTYHAVTKSGNNSITFKDNGKLEVANLNDKDNFLLYFAQYGSFTVKDSTRLILKHKADTTTQTYSYKIEGDNLSLIPIDPYHCIEGCGTRFKKAK